MCLEFVQRGMNKERPISIYLGANSLVDWRRLHMKIGNNKVLTI